jgi:hypothetical protein
MLWGRVLLEELVTFPRNWIAFRLTPNGESCASRRFALCSDFPGTSAHLAIDAALEREFSGSETKSTCLSRTPRFRFRTLGLLVDSGLAVNDRAARASRRSCFLISCRCTKNTNRPIATNPSPSGAFACFVQILIDALRCRHCNSMAMTSHSDTAQSVESLAAMAPVGDLLQSAQAECGQGTRWAAVQVDFTCFG